MSKFWLAVWCFDGIVILRMRDDIEYDLGFVDD